MNDNCLYNKRCLASKITSYCEQPCLNNVMFLNYAQIDLERKLF